MQYNFTKTDLDLNEFIDAYASGITIVAQKQAATTTSLYKKIFSIINRPFDEEELLLVYEEIARYKIANNTPYTFMSNEIYGLKSILISNIHTDVLSNEIVQLLNLFQNINNRVAYVYLMEYAEHLISTNNTRINSISHLVEKEFIAHYESHLTWIIDLAKHIKASDIEKFPELDDALCSFGQWLHNDAKHIISNNIKCQNLLNLHANLHLFAKKILHILEKNEYHVLLTYLEKCELISLSIGTELALLNQILINTKTTKDSLTGSLNRNALRSIFESQYDLSLATENPFVFAMCDLDFFKNINDTYGHVAGDKLLTLFVDTVKKNIRNSDVIIRYGGEEFIIMLPTIAKEKGFEILDTLRCEFEKTTLEFDNNTISATVSIGMIEIKPEHLFKHRFLDDYLMLVDKRLYEAKDSGRNRVITC